MPFEIGSTVGAYRITAKLGQGGMATVYKAYHASMDRFVAIKVLHSAFKDDDSFYIRFQREAQIVGKLTHPNIVPIYDFATHETDPYIVMQFIEGETLKHRLKRQHLSLEETLSILPAVASALTYAHDRNILHRDVKPSNVLIDNNDIPFLADFGLARIASSGESTMSQDVLIGTPNYISPEQAKGEHNLGAGTDIYSLGIMLYEIVVGRVPFSADTPYAVVHDHIYKPLPIPTHVNPTVPVSVERVLLKSLSKEPEDRYQSAVEMIDDFRSAVEESNLNELSAASVQVERFNDLSSASGSTPDTPTSQNISDMVNAAVAQALSSQSEGAMQNPSATPTPTPHGMQTPMAIPPVYPSGTPPPYSTAHRQGARRRTRRNFWALAGCAALVFICIASLAVTINATQNPILQSNPALVEADDNLDSEDSSSDELSDEEFADRITEMVDLNLSVEDAQAIVDDNPEDAYSNLLLSFAYLESGNQDDAFDYLETAIYAPNSTGELFAGAARVTAAEGFSEQAILLWAVAYALDPENTAVRNNAGEYLYRQLENATPSKFETLTAAAQGDPFMDNALTKTMQAHAMIEIRRFDTQIGRNQITDWLDEALELNDSFAEAHLIYGNYYQSIDEMDEAIASWRFAASFEDAPDWVSREVDQNLGNLAEVGE